MDAITCAAHAAPSNGSGVVGASIETKSRPGCIVKRVEREIDSLCAWVCVNTEREREEGRTIKYKKPKFNQAVIMSPS